MIGSKDFESALENVSSGSKKEIAKGIAIASAIEQESIDFYSAQEKKMQGADIKEFFGFLTRQEQKHLELIDSLRLSFEFNKNWKPQRQGVQDFPKIFSKTDWDKSEEPGALTAVLFAFWKEKQAQEFYLGIAARAKDSGVKKFFLELAEFEKAHAELLGEIAENSYQTHELIMG